MAGSANTTFGSLQTEERFKKLERSLKVALLRRNLDKNVHKDMASPIPTWPSFSSINAIDSSSTALQVSHIGSEVVASSNNLKCMLSKKRCHDTNQEVMATSSVRNYNVKQDNYVDRCNMPPPMANRVRHTYKKTQGQMHTLSDCKKPQMTPPNRSIPSYAVNDVLSESVHNDIAINMNNNKEYLHSFITPMVPTNSFERVFSKWRVILNDDLKLIIKGTLDCGKVARSKPIETRNTATCVNSENGYKYILQGNIVDKRNELPHYIREKFYNGFPDDWKNVYQIWKTYVRQGCPVIYRWPTPITDSDDDLKSELTDLTYTCAVNKKTNTAMNYHESNKSAEQSIKFESLKSPKKTKLCFNNSYNLQNHEKTFSSTKSSVFNAKATPIAQTSDMCDSENRDINTKVNLLRSIESFIKVKNILQDNELSDTIIRNLKDENCSLEYIKKIIEMLDCMEYVVSYRARSEYDSDIVVPASCKSSKSEIIPLQSVSYRDNHMNINKLENTMKCHTHCSLEHRNTKNYSNPICIPSTRNSAERQRDSRSEDLDKSESKIYAGIPKISIEQVLRAHRTSGKIFKRNKNKRMIISDATKHVISPRQNTNIVRHDEPLVRDTAMSRNLNPDVSCVSITEEEEEEIETSYRKKYHTTNSIMHKQNERVFDNFEVQRVITPSSLTKEQKIVYESQKNSRFADVDYATSSDVASTVSVQTTSRTTKIVPRQSSNFDTQEIKSNIFMKDHKITSRTQSNVRSQFADIDYTINSDVESVTGAQKIDETVEMMPRAIVDQEVIILNSDSTDKKHVDKTRIPRKLRREFVEQLKSEPYTMTKAKPTIISSVPVHLNLRISKNQQRMAAQLCDSEANIVKSEDKQPTNIWSMTEKTHGMKSVSKALSEKPVSNFKTIMDNRKNDEISNTVHNDENELNDMNPANSIKSTNSIAQSKDNKFEKVSPKVLTAWMPMVVYNSKSNIELGLVFQGKLLNECDHVVHRKFTTGIVLRRISATLIETEDHAFYQLLGSLNSKHDIPKELVKHFRNGCPAKIEQFCLAWKSLQHGEVEKVGERLYDTSMDSLSVPVSSRGRRILPPLCYWTGERVTLKDNTPIYSPGTSQETLLATSLNKSLSKALTNSKERKRQTADSKNSSKKNSSNEQKLLSETNKTRNKNEVTDTSNMNRLNSARKAAINCRRKIMQQFSSTDSEEDGRIVSPRKRGRKSQPTANNENLNVTPSKYTRKQQKIEKSSNRVSQRDASKSKQYGMQASPTKKLNRPSHNMVYTYYQSIPQSQDLLSEDQMSSI